MVPTYHHGLVPYNGVVGNRYLTRGRHIRLFLHTCRAHPKLVQFITYILSYISFIPRLRILYAWSTFFIVHSI